MRCPLVCGVGVRHIQYLFMATMNCLDFWINELNKSMFLSKDWKADVLSYALYSLGRLMSAWIVLKINNKYFLLLLIMFENGVGTAMAWSIHHFRFVGIMTFIVITSFTRAFHTVFMYNILSKWMPPSDYTTAFCIITVVKEMFSFLLGHVVAEMTFIQTQVAFSLLTFVCFGWCGLYIIFGAASPQTSFLISKQEWNYLSRTIGRRKKVHCRAKIPIKAIMLSCIFYSYVLLDFGKEANAGVITKAVYGIARTSLMTSFRHICMQSVLMLYSLGLLVACIFVDKAIAKGKILTGPFRKVMTTVGCCGIAISTVLASYVDLRTAKIMYLFFAECLYMIVHTAEPAILFELTPNYAASVYGIFSFMRNLLMIAKGLVDPKLHQFDSTLKEANSTSHISPNLPDGMIYRYGFMIFFTNLFFIISGNIELKDFDSYDTYDWRKDSVISYP